MADLTFPEGFVWGSATAAHQVEGNNVQNDCWAMEHARPRLFREPSGDAVDQYHRFGDDMAILAALGLKAYRFSVEWARIEPEDGAFSQAELDHYRRCVDHCLSRGIEPVVTLQHFTLPLWVVRAGGLADAGFADRFARYAERVAKALPGVVTVCTINELNIPIRFAEGTHQWRNFEARKTAAEAALGAPLEHTWLFAGEKAVVDQGLKAHALAREAWKAVNGDAKVGLTLSIGEEYALPGAETHRDARLRRHYGQFLDALHDDEFVGVQTYTRSTIRPDGTAGPAEGARLTTMGYEDYPPAVANCCRWVASQIKTPIIVTESGFAGDDDQRRGDYVEEVLRELNAAIQEGVNIRGYYYWSLLDNFEWFLGYAQRFGIVGVDRITQTRAIKPSAVRLGEIARRNAVPA